MNKELIREALKAYGETMDMRHECDAALSELDKSPEVGGGWISVEEQEPPRGSILAYVMENEDKSWSVPEIRVVTWVRHGDLQWPRFQGMRSRIKFWQPLPLPPKP